MPKIDFTTAEEPSFEPLPAGVYNVRVDKADITKAKDKDTYYVKVEFGVLDEGFTSRKLWLNMSLNFKPADDTPEARKKAATTLGMFRKNLVALGYDRDSLMADFDFDEADMIGRTTRALVSVGTNPATGEANNSVKRLLPQDENESVLL